MSLGPLPDKPTIGVYALTYNHEEYIAEAIESVLSQGWPSDRLQFVLLDDGSTDATPEHVKPYLNHLTYVRQDNQGINAAVNRLVSMVDGDVLVPLSGDDMWPPGKLELVVSQLQERPEVGLLYGDMEAIDRHGKVLIDSLMPHIGPPGRGQIAGRLLERNIVSGGAMAIRGALRDVMIPIPEAAAWEDWWFAWALTNVAPVEYIDAVVYRYRRHGRNYVFGLDDRETVLDRNATEVPFRRYMLGNAHPGTCSPRELLRGADALRGQIATLTSAGRSVEAFASVTDSERSAGERLANEAAAIAGSAPVLAAFGAARALAADPFSTAAYRVLHDVAGAPANSVPFFDDVRTVTVVAQAEEMAHDPSLLSAYVRAVKPDDDVTLIVAARDWDANRLGAELGPLVDRVAGSDAPDILALPAGRGTWLNAVAQADCALGLRDLPVPGIPRFDEAVALREFVVRRKRIPLRRS